jgi:hypothetical protein
MKKFLFLSLVMVGLMFTANTAKAQFGTSASFTVVAGDSLATADTVLKKLVVTAGYNSIGIQVDIKKGTGTLDGKFFLYTSVNGNRYVLTDSASFTAVPTFGSLNANGGYTHTAIITKTTAPGTAYIIAATQTGSLTASPVKVSYTLRRHD